MSAQNNVESGKCPVNFQADTCVPRAGASGGADLLRGLALCAVVEQPVLEDWLWGAGPAQSDSSGAQLGEAQLSGAE